MSLISQRSLWDWARKIARQQNERFGLVLAELLSAIDLGELPATGPHTFHSKPHELLKGIVESIRINDAIGEPITLYGLSGVTARIFITTSAMEKWLARKLARQPLRVANLPTGMPGRPSKGKEIIAAEFGRRAKAGEVLLSLEEEAEKLRTWYKETHPDA